MTPSETKPEYIDVIAKTAVTLLVPFKEEQRRTRNADMRKRAIEGTKSVPRINLRFALKEENLQTLASIVSVAARLGHLNAPKGCYLPTEFDVAHIVKLLERFEPFVPPMFTPAPNITPKPWIDEFDGKEPANPFAKETEDVPSQIFLKKHHPDLAEALELRATPMTYARLGKLLEARRQLAEALAYTGPNMFDESVEYPSVLERAQAQRLLADENPILAEQLKTEGRMDGTGINPWNGAGNASRQMVMLKRDPDLAHLCRCAAFAERAQIQAERLDLEEEVRLRKAKLEEAEQRARMRR